MVRTLNALGLCACLCAVAWAEDFEQPNPEVRVSLDFTDAPMAEVMEVIAKKVGAKIVVAGDVDVKVTECFRDIPWRLAVELIAKTYDCTHEERAGVLHVELEVRLDNELARQVSKRLGLKPNLVLRRGEDAQALSRTRDRGLPGFRPAWTQRIFSAKNRLSYVCIPGLADFGDAVCYSDPYGLHGVSGEAGVKLWSREVYPRDEESYSAVPIARYKDELLSLETRGQWPYLLRLDPRTGEELGAIPLIGVSTTADLFVTADKVTLADGSALAHVDLVKGKQLYVTELGDYSRAVTVGESHAAFVQEQNLAVYRRIDGAKLWTLERASFVDLGGRAALLGGSVFVALWEREAWWVVRLDLKTGEPRAHLRVPELKETAPPELYGYRGLLYLSCFQPGESFLSAVDPTSFQLRWTRSIDSPLIPPHGFQGELFVVNTYANEIAVLSATNGQKQTWVRLQPVERLGLQHSPQVTRHALYFVQEDGLLVRHVRLPNK